MTVRRSELSMIAGFPPTEMQIALAGLLSEEFQNAGIILTVVGGSAVQYYTRAEYVTKDLDAILFGDDKDTVDRVMGNLGFKRTTTYRHFEHPSFPFVVEFPPSPIEVGGRHISEVNSLRMGEYAVRVIRVEDIIMDRIIAGVEWRSERHLGQARLLWLKNKDRIDRPYLRQFAEEEGCIRDLKRIMKSDGGDSERRKTKHESS